MIIEFDKFQGAGNDFVILDNKLEQYNSLSSTQIAFLCDRHKGIGADGLICINNNQNADFEMQYFNSDGNESTLCGNGGRCAVAFAFEKKIIGKTTVFSAVDGLHRASYVNAKEVHLEMKNVSDFKEFAGAVITDTGSPHYVSEVEDVHAIEVRKEGAAVRYSDPFMPNGINVNFVTKENPTHFQIRTYERGVENETLACGTGAVAVALAMHFKGETAGAKEVHIQALGGDLKVSFDEDQGIYSNIFLIGPAMHIFSGRIKL